MFANLLSRQAVIDKWLAAAEAAEEDMAIRFGHIRPGECEPRWVCYSHAEFDGIGAMADILRRGGSLLEALPQGNGGPSPSAFMSVLRFLPGYLAPRRPLKWIPLECGPVRQKSSWSPSLVAWHVFDESALPRIRQAAHNAGVTINSLLLYHLTRAVRPFLEDRSAAVPWMIPVNLRGSIRRPRDTDNHTSYLVTRVGPFESAADIHRRILGSLRRGEHWGNWHVGIFVGNCLSHRMRMRIVSSGLAASQWTAGLFSNIGDWDPEKRISSTETQGAWIACPPVFPWQMAGGTCLTFQGRMSLCLRAHPRLTASAAAVREWMRNWVAGVEAVATRETRHDR